MTRVLIHWEDLQFCLFVEDIKVSKYIGINRPRIFLGCKISADGDCSHEIKRCLLFGRKVVTNLDSLLKSRDITLLTKVCLVKAMIVPVRVGP